MGSTSTTTQKADPWGPAQPYILEGLDAAQGMWNSNPNQFVVAPWQGSAVAREDPALQAARDAMGGYTYQQPTSLGPYTPTQPSPTPGPNPQPTPWPQPDLPQPQPDLPNPQPQPQPTPQPTPQPDAPSSMQKPPMQAMGPQMDVQGMQGMQGWPGSLSSQQRAMGPQMDVQGMQGMQKPPMQAVGPQMDVQGMQMGSNTAQRASIAARPPGGAQVSPTSIVAQQAGLANQAQQGVNQIGNYAASNPMDPRFNQGVNLGMNQSNDPRFNSGIAGAQRGTNAAGFDRAINNMTGDGYDQRLRNRLRSNVNESVMPGVNSTFANSGMTGSSLHQQNLARGLASGMAGQEAEFLNRAQDRQFQAGTAAQNALMANRGMSLQAGGMAQDASEAARQRAMQAGGMAQQAGMANRGQALSAYGMNNQMQQGAYNPYMQQQAVGEARTRDAQTQLAADIMAQQQAQAGPIDAVNNYLSLTSGLGGQFGSSTATARQNPGLLGILGGVGQMLPFF